MSACSRVSEFHVHIAAGYLKRGGVIAHATEGVWGLACDPFDRDAVWRLLDLKRRTVDKGLIVIGAQSAAFAPELATLAAEARAEIVSSWPGAVTWVLPNQRFPDWITGRRAVVACRVPGHPQSRALCAAFGAPLVSTSANASGRPATASELKLRRWLAGRADYVLPGATLGRRGPSEIRTVGGGRTR
jgi:L-threonylcarbamoyladenylate synthase